MSGKQHEEDVLAIVGLSAVLRDNARIMKYLSVACLALFAARHGLAATLEGRSFDPDFQVYEARETHWPYGPFHTEGRDIVNARGEKVKWAGVNWPMSGNPALSSASR